LGFGKDSYERCRAGIIYVLNKLSDDGHCYATREQLTAEAVKILEVTEDNIFPAIDVMIKEKSVIADYEDSIYLPSLYHSEAGVAKRIKEIVGNRSMKPYIGLESLIEGVQEECSIIYDDVQIEAIKTAVQSKFMVLTGGPGTGKTTTTQAIIKAFQRIGYIVLLAAPTGRASKGCRKLPEWKLKQYTGFLSTSPMRGIRRMRLSSRMRCSDYR
jgi:exodeoxyribonuclease V alpha subunit